MTAIGEKGGGVFRATRHEILPKAFAVLAGEGGTRRQLRVGLRVAWQKTEHDAALARHRLDLIEAVAPVGRAAEDAENDKPGVREGVLDVEINRQRVLQLEKVGEPQRTGACVMGTGEGGQFAVGRREDHDVGRRLREIDGFRAAVDHARCRGEEVHQPRSMVAIASRSMCFSPMTTIWVPRASAAFHGRSK